MGHFPNFLHKIVSTCAAHHDDERAPAHSLPSMQVIAQMTRHLGDDRSQHEGQREAPTRSVGIPSETAVSGSGDA